MRRAWCLLFVLAGCAGKTAEGPQMPFKALVGPVIIAHRGGSLEVPENTVTAIEHGVAVGADWQELDVTLSRDGQLVVIHDDTLERTTDGEGMVATKTLEQLRKLDAGNPKWADYVIERLRKEGITPQSFEGKYPGERIPTLDEVLKVPDARLMVEMKQGANTNALADATVDAIRKNNMEGRVILASFDTELLIRANLRDSSLPLLGLAEDTKGMQAMLQLPLSVLGVSTEMAEEALAAAPKHVAVWTWTVYSPLEARRLAELGVHGLITDAPTTVLGEIRKPQGTMVDQ